METFLPPAAPSIATSHSIEFREPWALPPVKPGEEVEAYITAVNHEAPFEYFDLGSVCFSKKEFHPDRSLAQNDGKYFPPLLRTTALSESQAEACRERAKARKIKIPSRPNPDFKPDDPTKGPEYLPAYEVVAADWLIIEPAKDYRPFMPAAAPPAYQEPKTTAEEIENSIYEAQGKKKGKN